MTKSLRCYRLQVNSTHLKFIVSVLLPVSFNHDNLKVTWTTTARRVKSQSKETAVMEFIPTEKLYKKKCIVSARNYVTNNKKIKDIFFQMRNFMSLIWDILQHIRTKKSWCQYVCQVFERRKKKIINMRHKSNCVSSSAQIQSNFHNYFSCGFWCVFFCRVSCGLDSHQNWYCCGYEPGIIAQFVVMKKIFRCSKIFIKLTLL